MIGDYMTTRGLKTLVRSSLDRYFGRFATKADINNLYLQLDALLEIKELIGPGLPVGPLRGWALSPDALVVILREVVSRTTPRVVEFGSGASTIAIAAALKAAGAGSLTSVEHDPDFANGVIGKLRIAGLLDFAEVRTVPLLDYEARDGLAAFRSYDLEGLETEYDIALIDGPPESFGVGGRSIPLGWVAQRMRGSKVAFLDDANRPNERYLVDRLKQSWPEIDTTLVPTEKGLIRMCRGSPGSCRQLDRDAVGPGCPVGEHNEQAFGSA